MQKAKSSKTVMGSSCPSPTAAERMAVTREVTRNIWRRRLRVLHTHAQAIPKIAAKSQMGKGTRNEFTSA
jgi:hypothetical protein